MASAAPRVVGRYALYRVLASGGMASVHLGCLQGPVGFSRIVAIKRMLPQYAGDPEFVAMFLEEARLASRVRHPKVVPVIDVVAADGEVLLVMEYVRGETLSRLLKTVQARGERMPLPIVSAIMVDVLEGLHSAHEALDEHEKPLGIVHRDVSPQNMIVGVDGTARVLDFGIAKAIGRAQVTREGQLKGKLAYMAPEQLHGEVTRRTDIYAAGVVLWEALTNGRLFEGNNEGEMIRKILLNPIEPPSSRVPEAAPYDAVVLKALSADPEARYATARDMALALAKCAPQAEPHEVGEWVALVAKEALGERHELLSQVETAVTAVSRQDEPGTTGVEPPVRRRRRSLEIAGGAILLAVLSVAATLAATRVGAPSPGPAVSSTTSAPISPVAQALPPPVSASAVVSAPPPMESASTPPATAARPVTAPSRTPRPGGSAAPSASSRPRAPEFL